MRILIDTTAINLHGRPLTGIPRVVRNYLTLGYRYGAAHGIEVLPVTISGRRLVLQRASRLFPHPEGLSPSLSRAGPGPMLLLALHYTFLGAAFALFALPWGALNIWRRIRGAPPRPEATAQELEPLMQALQRPAGYFWHRYMGTAPIQPGPEDILFCPAYWHDVDPEVYATLRRQMRAIFLLVHDIIPVTHPELYRAPWRDDFRANVAAALQNFTGVVSISGYTADMLRAYFPEDAAHASISVCHNGLDPLLRDDESANRMAPLFPADCAPYLMVGTIEPKKGHLLVLRVLEALWDSAQTRRKLVILGRTGWMYDAIVEALKQTRHRDKVVWIRDATDAELGFAYRHAQALIHASTTEGFGLPLIECAAHETPVVSNRSAIAAEVLGPYGLYFERNEESLREVLVSLEDAATIARLRARIADFAWPAWEDVVPALLDTLVAAARDGTPLPPEINPRRTDAATAVSHSAQAPHAASAPRRGRTRPGSR